MTKHYAGIGSRETPASILSLMTKTARTLAAKGYVLRSGAAPGADSAFETGAGTSKEIYLPWRGFNGSSSLLHTITDEALEMAASYHPAWHRCSAAARKLHARNCHQILGDDLKSPVDFVLCWTVDGGFTGGTGQALRIADDHKIPIFNLYFDEIKSRVEQMEV